MSLMLPSVNSAELSLADVLPSCLSALGVSDLPNRAGLPTVRSAIVVVVDGLGALNISAAKGHARFLADAQSRAPRAHTVFPSTTAAALATLTTGAMPGEHGLLGYKIRDPRSGTLINQLNGLGAIVEADNWCRKPPLYARSVAAGIQAYVVAHSRFESTPLTAQIHAGAGLVNANTLEDRFEKAASLASATSPSCVLIYISELDELAHKQGVNSAAWAAALESVDAGIKKLATGLPVDVGLIVTADHGVIDIPAHKQLLFGDDEELMADVVDVGGEPRGLQLYLSPNADVDEVAKLWRESFSDYAWVLTRQEAIEQGLFPGLGSSTRDRVGDVLVIARKDVVFYDARDNTMAGRQMVGQHGGLSDAELRIPFIKLAAFDSVLS